MLNTFLLIYDNIFSFNCKIKWHWPWRSSVPSLTPRDLEPYIGSSGERNTPCMVMVAVCWKGAPSCPTCQSLMLSNSVNLFSFSTFKLLVYGIYNEVVKQLIYLQSSIVGDKDVLSIKLNIFLIKNNFSPCKIIYGDVYKRLWCYTLLSWGVQCWRYLVKYHNTVNDVKEFGVTHFDLLKCTAFASLTLNEEHAQYGSGDVQ